MFTTSDNITDFTLNLTIGGRSEDGYSAIRTALDSYEFRDVARQFILITDEDRDPLDVNLTRDTIMNLLKDESVILNVVVSEEYSASGVRALGIDSAGSAFVFDPSAQTMFRTVARSGLPIPDSAHGTTSTDYSQLALNLNGATWDISQLRQGIG